MHKAPTTADDPVRGVLHALAIAAEAASEAPEAFLARADLLVHGTTHAINAIVTGRTARTAFVTTAGHPDTLVFREGGRQEAFNFHVPYPDPFVPKALTWEIPERIGADGLVRRPFDRDAAAAVADALAARRVEAVAVCFLWSVVNPDHEIAMGEILQARLPGVPVTLSHRLNPSVREYRRAMSACLDASLKPVMGRYMGRLEAALAEAGFGGRLLVVTSQGGMMDAADAGRAPVHLINSGPSMAPIAARALSRPGGPRSLIVGDTGGTTFDVSLVRDGRIPRTRETWLGRPLSSHMTGMPSVDTRSIGAGGGSVAWVDEGGLLRVGPESAGADPGPAAYGKGGLRPTVTDACVVLGIIAPDHFLGGRMRLDAAAAAEAVRRDVAGPLGLGLEPAAAAILELATEHMVQAIMDITVNQGIDPAEATFVAGGGAAGLNCVAIARRLGCREALVPETGAALAAAGALISDLVAHRQAVHHADSRRFDREGVNAVLARLETDCRAFAAAAGQPGAEARIDWTAEARYPDQAWEIEVPLRGARFRDDGDVAALVEDFHRTHQDVFAISDAASPIEAVGWSASVHCRIGAADPGRLAVPPKAADLPARPVFLAGRGWTETPVLRFEALAEDERIEGPAVVESAFTSVLLDPGAVARRDEAGTLRIEVG